MSLKKLGLAAVIAASASSANAWDFDGELILTVWNSATETSFSQELDVNTLDAQNLALGTTFNLNDAGLAHIAGNAADISWNVAGMSNPQGAGLAGLIDDSIYVTLSDTPNGGHNTALSGDTSRFQAYNTTLSTGTVAVEAGTQNAVLLSGGSYAGDDFIWGESLAGLTNRPFATGATTLLTSAAAGESLYAYSFDVDFNPALPGFEFPVTQSAGLWSIDLVSGTASYAAVPVPAAVWMFASGLIGLAGVARRNRKA